MVHFISALVTLLLAVTVHEVCHGYAALRLGDDTAYHSGRLTLNPVAHLDLIGSILLPALLYFGTRGLSSGPIIFGWAKPVPVNPLRFRRDFTMRSAMSIVAAAGPLSNILLAVLFAGVYHSAKLIPDPYASSTAMLAKYAITTNLYLAFFNFIPIPPLDGSKVLLHFLHPNLAHAMLRLEPYGFLIVILLFNYTPLGLIVAVMTYAVQALLLGRLG